MPEFSKESLEKLQTCHYRLQGLFREVIKNFDCIILEGHRDKTAQDLAFKAGKSKLQWPNGKHNSLPSLAIDVAPYPVDWNNIARFYWFGGYVMGMAQELNYNVRYGGDWNRNYNINDESFKDLVHFELIL